MMQGGLSKIKVRKWGEKKKGRGKVPRRGKGDKVWKR